MDEAEIKVYRYRWVVLAVFALINAVMQLQWLTYAPIAREARILFQASPLQVDFLSMIFMVVFLVMCIPASFVIDTYGLRIGVGFGAVLIGIFGMMKGLFADSYTMAVVSQIGLATAQPFILNACTKVGVRWFPIQERATAVGIATLAQFIGIIAVMIATPLLVSGVEDIGPAMLIYGVISLAGSILLLALLKERPPTPPCAEGEDERFRVFEGFRHIFRQRDMLLIMVLFFIGLGMFNAISTCIDQICQIKGLSVEETGMVGGIMLIAGIAGAVILPPLSDRYRMRKPLLILVMACMTPGLIGLTVFTSYPLLLASSFVLGFFLLGGGAPIGFQYSAEVSYPAPESSSQGIILLAGQISGILFIFGMNTIGMMPFMAFYILLAVVNVALTLMIRESPAVTAGKSGA